MTIEAGRLRHVIDIQQRNTAKDATTGEITITWATIYSDIFAAIEPVSVREFVQFQSIQSEVTAKIIIRHLPDLDGTIRLVGVCGCHKDKIYNPAGALEDKDSGVEHITFPCTQGVNDGSN